MHQSTNSTQSPAPTTTSKDTVQELSKYLDDFRLKDEGDYRILIQNPRGIKEFRDNDPEYYPTMLAMQEGQCDFMGFVETNVPWHI